MLPEGYALWTNNTTVNKEEEGDDTASTKYRMKKPGLPNITGYVDLLAYGYNRFSGAFMNTSHEASDINGAWGGGFNMRHNYIDFNASESNPIYGNSITVQPPAYKVYAWKRIA